MKLNTVVATSVDHFPNYHDGTEQQKNEQKEDLNSSFNILVTDLMMRYATRN